VVGLGFIKERLEIKLREVITEVMPDVREIKYEVKSSLLDEENPDKMDSTYMKELEGKRAVRKVPNKQEVIMQDGMRSKMFNPKYTLDSFIPGNENRLVHAACKAVAARPGNIYNPLFVFGGVGLGKTHLLQATGLEIMRNHPNMNVVYMTSEKFANEVIEAIGSTHKKSFKDRYRNLDCLIVDDVQFFGNKPTTQQEFFHTFNELYDAGKQLILSSDRPPNELGELERRLTSRFGMGMVVEMLFPDFETRMAILNSKCQEYEALIDHDVLEFIAFNVNTSVREMVGVLVKAIAEATLTETNPTIRSVAETIKRLNRNIELQGMDVRFNAAEMARKIVVRTNEDVIDLVAGYYKITKSEIISEDRRKEVMIPRQVCMYLIRAILNQSYETIGESFSGRNHTTVMHAVSKMEKELQDDSKIKRDINALKREIGV
jgi:chromosomal replication initiator protein